jgi:hypothetical protein
MTVDVPPTMVHVAAASENRGRVVLRLAEADPNRIAIEAALRVARAYQSSLESVYIEDQQLLDVAAHEDINEISLCGRERRTMSAASFMRQFAYAARQAERRIAVMARLADIPYRARTMRDTPLHAMNRACAEAGPWNVIAFADVQKTHARAGLLELMSEVAGVTGFVLVGPAARRTHGPIVVVLEETERLQQTLRTAERLASEAGDPVMILLVAPNENAHAVMDHAARLMLDERIDIEVRTAPTVRGDPAALAELLRRLGCGFVVGQAGRTLLPDSGHWSALMQTLECPLFIVK